jgi:drug/metabolite transporter (DMT)-like permease
LNRHALLLIAAMLLVGGNVGLGKSIVEVVPVTLFALLRFVIALAVLWPLLRFSRRRRVRRGEWLNLFLQALFGTFLFTLLMLGGVHRTSAVAAGVIASTIPAVVALLSWLFLKERPDARVLLAIALAIAGVVVISVARGSGETAAAASAAVQANGAVTGGYAFGTLLGNLMVLGAVFCESIYVILSRRLTQTLPAIDICAYTHLFGFLLMLPFGTSALLSFDYASLSPRLWVLMLWYGLSASIFSFWLWMKGIRHVPGTLAGVFTAVLPIAAATYGIVFLGERPSLAHGVALLCVVAGIGLASLRNGRVPPVSS